MNEPARMTAALLSFPDAVFSHGTALRLHGLDTLSNRIELTRPRRTHAQDGYTFHRSILLPEAREVIDHLPVTKLRRTLFDVAATGTLEQLAVAIESAWRLNLLNPARWLAQLKDRSRTRFPAPPQLIRVLRDARRRTRPLDSALEVLFLYRGRAFGLPEPVLKARCVDDYGQPLEPDFSWPNRRVVVETMGFEVHGTREAFEQDAFRVLRLAAAGYTVVPITWRMLERGDQVFALIQKVLRSHPLRRWRRIVYDAMEIPLRTLPPEVRMSVEALTG